MGRRPGCWIEPIDALSACDVDAARVILGQREEVVARQTVRHSVAADLRRRSVWSIDASQTTAARTNPEPSLVIGQETVDRASRCASDLFEASVVVTDKATGIKADPNL